jgi:hypothetical protein
MGSPRRERCGDRRDRENQPDKCEPVMLLCHVFPPGNGPQVAMPDCRGASGEMCELRHTSAVVQKMQSGQNPHGIGDYLGPGHVGVEKAPAITGRGKLSRADRR